MIPKNKNNKLYKKKYISKLIHNNSLSKSVRYPLHNSIYKNVVIQVYRDKKGVNFLFVCINSKKIRASALGYKQLLKLSVRAITIAIKD